MPLEAVVFAVIRRILDRRRSARYTNTFHFQLAAERCPSLFASSSAVPSLGHWLMLVLLSRSLSHSFFGAVCLCVWQNSHDDLSSSSGDCAARDTMLRCLD